MTASPPLPRAVLILCGMNAMRSPVAAALGLSVMLAIVAAVVFGFASPAVAADMPAKAGGDETAPTPGALGRGAVGEVDKIGRRLPTPQPEFRCRKGDLQALRRFLDSLLCQNMRSDIQEVACHTGFSVRQHNPVDFPIEIMFRPVGEASKRRLRRMIRCSGGKCALEMRNDFGGSFRGASSPREFP